MFHCLLKSGMDIGQYDPCVDNEVATYLNRPEVQQAIHANMTGTIPGPWADCTDRITYSSKDLFSSMLPVYKKLLKTGMQTTSRPESIHQAVPTIPVIRCLP